MILPKFFRNTTDPLVASYDYIDYATGIGYKRYYICASDNDSGNTYFLTPETVPTDGTVYFINNASDTDFDYTVKNPIIIADDSAIFSYLVYCDAAGGIYVTFNLYHVNGVTETLIATATDAGTSFGAPAYQRRCLKAATTLTNFSIGQKIRLNVVTTGASTHRYFCDPAGRYSFTEYGGLGGTVKSDSYIIIPFKLNT